MSDVVYYSRDGVLSWRASSDLSSIAIPEGARVISEREYSSAVETARAQRQAADMARATEIRLNSVDVTDNVIGAVIDMSGKAAVTAEEPVVEKAATTPKKRKKSA